MPRSLGGRLVAAFAALALAIVIAVGGTLFVVLRGLHQEATLNGLTDVAGSVLPQVRDAIGSGDLRGTVAELQAQLAERGIELAIVGADGRLRTLGGVSFGPVLMVRDAAPGETVKGNVVLPGREPNGRSLYVATAVRRVGAAGPRAVAFIVPDTSGAETLGDLGRTIPIVVAVLLLVAIPLAMAASRSVTRPLRRLADATVDIPAGRAVPLPLEGPREVRELTGTFNAMAGEVEATRRREADLLANLRHDLRTPLTVISGFAVALRDGTASGEAADAAARAIEEEAARLERLVEQIGAVEAIGAGTAAIRPELLDARLVVAETVARFRGRASGAGIDIAAAPVDEAAGDAMPFAADRLAVERMLGNLVENALGALAAQPGGGHVVVAANLGQLPDGREAVRLDVVDDGPGFTAGGAAHAFERFWRGDPARAGSGTGLGLSIVRELALAHGGTAHAENLAARGARVGVTLPRVPWPPLSPEPAPPPDR